ncbi:hypothetical protein ACFVR2_07530 [Gottfriedia sp. NPDC057991]|uniref:hypothetical protein n=1 Tax=Gottfriedia sp. NPDC057991 TaxID=3346298 RepID=UPI0036DF3A3D
MNESPVIHDLSVRENKPIYFHPDLRRNKPLIEKKKFKGVGWIAEFTFGYAPTDEEYQEMGIDKPKQYDPYNVSLQKQGFDIIQHDRVINFAQLSELDLVPTKHNKYNYIRGEIDLIKGFNTSINKNFIMQDAHFKDLLNQIQHFNIYCLTLLYRLN